MTYESQLAQIELALKPYRNALQNHAVYHKLQSVKSICTFAELHVYAVWDFMSLLKSLQLHLTCTNVPWFPSKNPNLARFINEIVLEEETDVDANGHIKSHYEMYLDAMQQLGASTKGIHAFMQALTSGISLNNAWTNLDIDQRVKNFVSFTFNTINTGNPHKIAAAFTFGREDIIPDIFIQILQEAEDGESQYHKFIYYLKRHIELDGDSHGPLSLQLVSYLCGNDDAKWKDVQEVSIKALQHRIALWDAIADAI